MNKDTLSMKTREIIADVLVADVKKFIP